MAQTKVKLISNGVITVDNLHESHGITTDNIGEGTNKFFTDARVASYLDSNNYATQSYVTTHLTTNSYATQTYVDTAVANLVSSAPTTLDTLNELAAALGDDPNFATTVTTSIGTKWTQDNTKISNWDTAYSWGNHASAGYLTSFDITTQTDPKYLRSDTSDTMSGDLDMGGNKITNLYGIVLNNEELTDLTLDGQIAFDLNDTAAPASLGTYGGSAPEGLYLRGSSTNYQIYHTGHFSGSHISNWQTAYTYSQIGHLPLTGGTLSGDVVISKADAKIRLYDSTGTSGNNPFIEFDTTAGQGIALSLNVYDSELPTSGYGMVVGPSSTNSQFPTTGTLTLNVLGEIYAGGTSLSSLNKVWHAGNDGSGSGLDADTVDGLQASQFLRSDASDTTSGDLTINGNIYGRSVNGQYSSLYRMGGIYFTWDSDSYGTNFNHSITSTYGGTYGDDITINSYGNVRINIDSNGNGTDNFSIGRHTTGTGNEMMILDESSNMTVYGSVRSPIFYDSNDTNSYFDGSGSGSLVIRGTSPTVYFRDNGHNSGMIHCNSDRLYILRGGDDTTTWTQVGGQWPGYWQLSNNAFFGGGAASFVGDVTANTSDKRLKENVKPIENALEKVKSINGVTFDWKDNLEEINYTRQKIHDVGVIAQEVQKVLPEIVVPAPFDTDEEGNSRSGDNYLTVQYEKIVPLLIEAIKEQQQQIEELKQLINK